MTAAQNPATPGRRTFVLDTSVLLSDPGALGRFGEREAIDARRADASMKVARVHDALKRLGRTGLPITKANVADVAGVSRTFLYENTIARQAVEHAVARSTARADARPAAASSDEDAKWHERALNAEQALKSVRRERDGQSAMIADLIGQLRDPDGTWLEDDRAELRAHNERLRGENAQLRRDNADLQRSLDAARSNVRRLRRDNVTTLFPDGPGLSNRTRPTPMPTEDLSAPTNTTEEFE